MPVEIVHITDLHFQNHNPFQAALIEALVKDLEVEKSKGLSADLLIISGDLVNNPEDKDIYHEFETKFLKPVLKSLELASSRVVLCPGNHDLSFLNIRSRQMIYSTLQNQGKDQKYISMAADGAELRDYATAISSGFFTLAEKYGGKWDNPFYKTYDFAELNVGVLAINTALGCCLEGSAADRGKLVFPVDLALKGFQGIATDRRILSTGHHPLSDMTEQTARSLTPIFEKRSHVHFFGHVHQPKPSAISSAVGACFAVQGGALYEREGYYNGYSIVRISDDNTGHAQAEYHTYYTDRQEFDVGTNVTKGGAFFSSAKAEEYFKKKVKAPSNDLVAYWLLEHAESLIRKYDSTLTNRKLLGTFVEPLLVRPKQDRSKRPNASIEKSVSINDLIKSRDHTVIATEHEFGATALLQYICMHMYQQCAEFERPVVPVIIDARRLKPYASNISSLIRAELPESIDASLKLQALHDGGRLLLLVDDYDPAIAVHTESIATIRLTYPKARLIIAAKIGLIYTDHLKPVVGVDHFLFLQMRPMNRGRIRTLIERWNLPPGYEVNNVLEEIVARFRRLGIPQAPAHVAIYLSILEDVKGYNPINSSSVIEQFVESVLEKYKPDYALRSSFDYRNQVSYLASMAEKMVISNTFSVPYAQFIAWTADYFDEIGIEQNSKSIVDLFYFNKILSIDGDVVFFRYNIYLSYFIAQRLHEASEFKSWLLKEKRYCNYVTELDLYCGLVRTDKDILEFLGAEFQEINDHLASLVAPLAWTSPLEQLQLPRVDDHTKFAEDISKQLLEPPPQAEQRDKELDEAPIENHRPALQRPDVQGILPNWILTLRAYTVALKNLENIPRVKKEEHISKVLDGWATVLRYACLLFRDLLETPVIQVGPMRFTLILPEQTPNEYLRLLFSGIPTAISHWVRNDLGSQKLEMQLRKDELATSITSQFLQAGLYADMKLENFIDKLERFYKQSGDSQFFMEALITKMRDIYFRFGLTTVEQKAFQELAGNLSADVKGLKGVARNKEMGKFIQSLKRNSQIKRLTDNRS